MRKGSFELAFGKQNLTFFTKQNPNLGYNPSRTRRCLRSYFSGGRIYLDHDDDDDNWGVELGYYEPKWSLQKGMLGKIFFPKVALCWYIRKHEADFLKSFGTNSNANFKPSDILQTMVGDSQQNESQVFVTPKTTP